MASGAAPPAHDADAAQPQVGEHRAVEPASHQPSQSAQALPTASALNAPTTDSNTVTTPAASCSLSRGSANKHQCKRQQLSNVRCALRRFVRALKCDHACRGGLASQLGRQAFLRALMARLAAVAFHERVAALLVCTVLVARFPVCRKQSSGLVSAANVSSTTTPMNLSTTSPHPR